MKAAKLEVVRLIHPMPEETNALERDTRLKDLGPSGLSDSEFLKALLGQRVNAEQALGAAGGLRQLCSEDTATLQGLQGLSRSAATKLQCAVELGRRIQRSADRRPRLRSPREIYEYLAPSMQCLPREQFRVLCLDGQNRLTRDLRVAEGTRDQCPVDPREVFAAPILSRSAGFIVSHNHPSGSSEPSQLDIQLTRQLFRGAQVLGLKLLDHVVVGAGCYVSFLERGLLAEMGTSHG